MYARTNEADWCENHGCNFSHFRHWPFEAEEEEEEEDEEEIRTNGGFGRFLPVSLMMHFCYSGGVSLGREMLE